MKWHERHVHAAVVLVTVALLSYYVFYRGRALLDAGTWNRVLAFGAVFLLGLTLLLGPLFRFWPRLFAMELVHRKALGLWGFAFAAGHVLISLIIARGKVMLHPLSIGFAAAAFVIFALMAFASTTAWMTRLGYKRWKHLQRTGYLAFFLVLLHVGILEIGEITEHPLIPFAFFFMLVVLLARVVALLAGKPKTSVLL